MSSHQASPEETGLLGVFVPETMLASQYFDRVRARQDQDPERRLMVAVFEQAISDYLKLRHAADPKGREAFREVAEWLGSTGSTWLYAFENICHVLGLDPDYIRNGLRARTAWPAAAPATGADASEPEFRRASA